MATGAISEQAELTFLDPVLHFSAGAVDVFIQCLRRVTQIGDHEARVGPLRVVLGFGDQPAVARPAASAVVKLTKDALRFLRPGKSPGGLLAPMLAVAQQDR